MREYAGNKNGNSEQIRTDAAAKRRAIIQAARKLFVKKGPEIPLTEIAEAAQVSRPTLYRNFTDRSELIVAVFHHNLDILERYARKIVNQKNEFILLLEAVVNQHMEFHALIGHVSTTDQELNQRFIEIFEAPAKRAISNGSLRNDFSIPNDLSLLIMMLGGAITHSNMMGLDIKKESERALQIIIEGI